jgi:hypothetical protein
VGNVQNLGTIVASGASAISGAYTSGVGSLLRVEGNGILGGAVLTISGAGSANNGAIVLTDVTSSYGATLTAPNGLFTNALGGILDAPLGTNGDRTLNAALVNEGTLTVATAAARKLTISPPAGAALANSGTITISGGTLQVTQSGANPSFTNSGSIQLTGGSFSLNQPSGATPGSLALTATGQVSIGSGRTFTVTGGTFTVPGGATITGTGTLALSSATANISPNFNTGLTGLNLLNSTWNGPGILTNPGGSTLNLQSSTVAAPFVNQGKLVATGSSQLTGSLTTGTGDSIIVQGNGTFGAASLLVSGGSWTNNGAIVLTDVVSSYGASLTVPNGVLSNPAGSTIDAPLGTSGDRTLSAALANSGTLTVGVAAARKLTISPPAGASWSNNGTIAVNSGTLQITQSGANPGFTNPGSIQLVGGSLSLSQPSGATPGTTASAGTLSIGTGRTFTVSGGVLTFPTGAVVTGAGTLALSGAIANVTPNFNTSLTGLSLLNSTWNGPGTLTNPGGSTLNLQSSIVAAPFVNAGTLMATGTSQVTGSFTTGAGDSIIVQGNGTFGAATLTVSGGSWTSNGAIVLTDVVSSYGATLAVPNGALTIPAGRTIEPLGTSGDRTLSAVINHGTLTVAWRRRAADFSNRGRRAQRRDHHHQRRTLQITQSGPARASRAVDPGHGGTFAQPAVGATPGSLALRRAASIGGPTFTVSGDVHRPAASPSRGRGPRLSATANVTPA